MTNYELESVIGGATNYTSASWLNSLVRILSVFLEIGRNIGSALNYAKNNKTC